MAEIKKALTLLCVLLLALAIPFSAFAEDDNYINDFGYEPYYITAYNVNINVTQDNILQINETIDAYFNESRHGIYRYIPTVNTVERQDGSSGTTHAKIRNVRCSDNYSSSYENGDYVMQIGDEDITLTGAHTYNISYEYQLGQDIADGFDELYYNIIGAGWDTYIQNVSFSIVMPKEFDESLLGFSSGAYKTAGTETIEYYVNGNEISGRLTKTLAPYEALTVRLELPEGYFYFNKAAHIAKLALMVLIPVLCLIFVLLIWKKHGKDKKTVKVVEFYPPEGMSSADVAYWYNGMLTNDNIVPMLIELANDGYITIRQTETKKPFRTTQDFVIESRKYCDSKDINKRMFYNGLFENGRTWVTKEDLEDEFYKTLDAIAMNYNTSENRKKVFDSKSLKMRLLCWAVTIACLLLNIFILNLTFGTAERFLAFFAGAAILVCAFIFSFFVRRRTQAGAEILQKIEGFKMFLKTAEKERLETLVNDNPEYFYDILPYAYVLDVSKEWTKNFESIAIEQPKWYVGVGPFDRMMMYSFMNSTMQSCAQAMTSSPQTSSSGGGGFSGGGSGGGGGGSW